MTQNCLGTIRSYYSKLSEKEKKIADYILEKPEIIIHRTINDVADDLNIADATVFRFSKRIGFKGFQAMKIALASEIMSSGRNIAEESTEKDTEKNLTVEIFKTNIRNLQNTLHQLENNSVTKAADLIINAKRVEFYGTGGSAVIAMDAFHKFAESGIKASSFLEAQFQLMSAAHLTEDDVAVIISHSGTNKDTVQLLKAINETGAKTIAITSAPNSPIGMNVDIALFTSVENSEYVPASFSSRIALLALIDVLCLNASNKKNEGAIFIQEQTRNQGSHSTT